MSDGIIIKKQSVRIEDSENKKLKKYLIDKEMSFQEYALDLIRKDMEKNYNQGGKNK